MVYGKRKLSWVRPVAPVEGRCGIQVPAPHPQSQPVIIQNEARSLTATHNTLPNQTFPKHPLPRHVSAKQEQPDMRGFYKRNSHSLVRVNPSVDLVREKRTLSGDAASTSTKRLKQHHSSQSTLVLQAVGANALPNMSLSARPVQAPAGYSKSRPNKLIRCGSRQPQSTGAPAKYHVQAGGSACSPARTNGDVTCTSITPATVIPKMPVAQPQARQQKRTSTGLRNYRITYRVQGNTLIRTGVAHKPGSRSLSWVNQTTAHTPRSNQPKVVLPNASFRQMLSTTHIVVGGHRRNKLVRLGQHRLNVFVRNGAGQVLSVSGKPVTSKAPAPKAIQNPSKQKDGIQFIRIQPPSTPRKRIAETAVQRSLKQVRAKNRAAAATRARGHCLAYCRFGVCAEAQKGNCHHVHDPSKVAVCTKWLQGSCEDKNCRLQHKVCKDLMPVCTYFLQGLCSNEDCPYLHVNYPSCAPVCQEFLNGVCEYGANCSKKHLSVRMMKQQQKAQQAALKAARQK